MNEKSNNVGFPIPVIQPVINQLGNLLANYQIFYTNIRGLHWNIEGDKFFELHPIYEEYYNEMAERIDTVAERIVMLGGRPENRFSEYLKISVVKEIPPLSEWRTGVGNVIETLQTLLGILHTLRQQALQAQDAGTIHLVTHDIKSFEKKIWMLNAYRKE